MYYIIIRVKFQSNIRVKRANFTLFFQTKIMKALLGVIKLYYDMCSLSINKYLLMIENLHKEKSSSYGKELSHINK
jgi:hypothetical protein